jgi:4-amino-4-deoxy-L-arabinose transferase-like glycosyltransferase
MVLRKMIIVGSVALLFRSLFLFWGLADWYLLDQGTLSKIYFLQGYGICAGYGYVTDPGWGIQDMVDQELSITPETAPRVVPANFVPQMLHPPGMALLVAALHRITGIPVDLFLEILGMFLDTMAVCILYWMVATFLSERVAFVAGLIYALYPPLAFGCTLDRTPEGIMSVFIVGALACVLQSTRSKAWEGALWWAGAGILIAASAYLRPDYLLVPVAIGLGFWLYTRRFRRSVLALITMQAVALALMVPWAYRNYQECGRWIFTSTSVGWTLVNGIGQYNNPWGIIGTDTYRGIEAKEHGFSSPASPEADLYFRQIFWDAVKSNPLGYVVAVAKRLPMAILSPQTFGFKNPLKTGCFTEQMEQHGKDRFDVILSNPFYIVKAYWDYLLMGLISVACLISSIIMLICERRRFGLIFLLLSPHLYSIGTHVLVSYEPRYVLPSMFSFIIGLAYVFSRGWQDRGVAIASTQQSLNEDLAANIKN